jgi:uncharacterized protein (UPF0332 family)
MTARNEAEGHLKKARDFLEAARTDLEFALLDPATSNAVLAGINAKDVICLMLTGTTKKTDNHASAIGELRSAGPAGADLVSTLQRLLKLKTKSQYQSAAVSHSDAERSIEWAQRMVDAAQSVMA